MTPGSAHVNFLGLTSPLSDPDTARFHVIPVSYEKTVSWGKGTSKGPQAILDASLEVELYDGSRVPAEAGIYTAPPLRCKTAQPAKAVNTISKAVSKVLHKDKILVLLGGEHTITVGAVKAIKSQGEDFGVVQFDAHADLREEYLGKRLSHACVMRRIVEIGVPIFQIGTRSCSRKEDEFRRDVKIGRLDAAEIAESGVPSRILPEDFPTDIYITFDVDVFDPSLIPSTGTPEPGGLFWYDTLKILKRVIHDRNVIGFDAVELAPVKDFRASDFTVARLVYSIIGMIVNEGIA